MKTLVYWIGLILIGFGIWVSFIALWIYLSINLPGFNAICGRIGVLVVPLAGALIFIVIGWRMMKEGR